MDGLHPELSRRFDAGKLLGYLNFSDGRPDARVRKAIAEAFAYLSERDDAEPWRTVGEWLAAALLDLEASGAAAFREAGQAKAVLAAAFHHLPRAYRAHHVDLLAHQPDGMLFTPFFIARGCEAVLQVRSKRADAAAEQLAAEAVRRLNDYVGYRPIALLETRAQTEFYTHEKVCPIPVYLNGAGVAVGPYADLIRSALELLAGTDASLREEGCYDADKLDELAIDPRAADHFHPVNKRPNVLFGEWDPHRIDGSGFFRRFILKQPTLDALLSWVAIGPTGEPSERRFEAAAVLAGTILMGAGVSGSGPTYFDSTVTLTSLVQRIARYRDNFYKQLLDRTPGPHGDRLRAESAKLKQPFAGVRQFLNSAIASERALHLQERRLSLLFAALGFPTAARTRAANIPAASVRFGCEIRVRQTEADFAARAGDADRAARLLDEAEELLRRGIDCGALIDPWNILGYQGLFPIFPGRDDTVRDPRAEELIYTVGRQFDRYAHALAAAGRNGNAGAQLQLGEAMMRLADWWDKFATPTVNDMPRVHGGERAEAATHVATALAVWQQATGNARDVKFWQTHREGFRTPAAFAQVIEALLDASDYKAAMALLMTWLGDAGEVPLQDPSAAFVQLAFRWMKDVVAATVLTPAEKGPLVVRFFELLEANADDRWQVPSIGRDGGESLADDDDDDDDDDDMYASAYEGMTYKDSTDDGVEGSLADEGPAGIPGEFPLEAEAERFEDRLHFLAAVARLWRTAARPDLWGTGAPAVADWLTAARRNRADLRALIERLSAVEVPPPSPGVEGVMEYDRRRSLKGHLLDLAVNTAVETTAAARRLAAALSRRPELRGVTRPETDDDEPFDPFADPGDATDAPEPTWEAVAVRLERAMGQGDATAARALLTAFVPLFRHEPLLVHPPADGGPPGPALRAQTALQHLESLLERLPRLGLLRETYQLAKLARVMERNDPPEGRRVSSFDQLFRTAVVGVADALAAAGANDDPELTNALRLVADSFHRMWLDHSQSLRLSALETVLDDADWAEVKTFIRQYGGDLFTVRFLTLSNIRGVLAQGIATWLDRLTDPDASSDGEPTPKLFDDWADDTVDKPKAARLLEVVLQSLVEHYDEYRDYNTTTTQSDYGDNLYILLDFLRLKVAYDRFAWRLRPLVLSHEVLCRRGHDTLAGEWREFIAGKTRDLADDLLTKLTARESEHGMRLRTVRDRLEERFVQPLFIDQAAARVASAAAAAKAIASGDTGEEPESDPAFIGLVNAVRPLAESPAGVGLDVPVWLRRLEDEVRKVRQLGDDDSAPEDAPSIAAEFGELTEQLADWEKPIGE